MPGCLSKCTDYRKDTIQHAWEDIRGHFGPITAWSVVVDSISEIDVSEWAVWAVANGKSINDVTMFGEWLIWRCAYGTSSYGNLPSRIRDHAGISCIPCPYSTDSTDLNTRLWLGLDEADPLPTRLDHGSYYLKVSSRGSNWGFECTYNNCPFIISTGDKYFHS